MKSYTQYVTFNTKNHQEFINIPLEVEEAFRKSGIKEGAMFCYAMYIISSIFINDDNAMHANP